MTIGTPMVLSVFDDWYSVYHSSKTVKRQSNSKKDHWCTNRHMSTQSPPNTQSRANAAIPCETSITRAWAVATARRLWAGLTVCVYMDVHASGSRSFAAACCYTLFYQLMMPAARLVCQRPSSNFPYFRTPLANFLLSRPNSVE